MATNFTFEVLISTYKRENLLERTLTSLMLEKIPDSLLGVLVIENGPKKSAEDVCRKFLTRKIKINYIHQPTLGLSAARNAGSKAAQADMLLFFDNDLRFSGITLQSYADAFNKFGLDFYYGGPLYPDYEAPPPEWIKPFLPPSAKGWELDLSTEICDCTGFLGGNHAVPRNHLLDIAGYDNICAEGEAGGVGEESRLQRKLLTKGLRAVYVPKAKVWHYVPKDRCTPEWILFRRYRHGLTEGKYMFHEAGNVRNIRNVPLWIWHEYLLLKKSRLLNILIGRRQSQYFETLCRLAEFRGIIDALKK